MKFLTRSTIALLFVAASFFTITSSASAADLNIIRPAHNEKVQGTIDVYWSVFNTGMPSVPYEMRIKNATCSDVGAPISGPNFQSSVANGYYNFPWNTGSVADGVHCLQLCIQNSSGAYECVQRTFEVINYTNNAPVITTSPPNTNLTTSSLFTYNIGAYDPDGDDFVYQLLVAPDFIYLDQTGKLALGNYMTVGTYEVSFAVIDIYGAANSQSFVLNVTQAASPTPGGTGSSGGSTGGGVTPTPTYTPTYTPTPSPTPTPTSSITLTQTPTQTPSVSPTPTPSTTDPQMVIVNPSENVIFRGVDNEIEWEIKNVSLDEISEIVVEYTLEGEESYSEITTFTGGTATTYLWDVTNIENGEYTVRISLLDSSGNAIISQSSDQFSVENRESEGKVLSVFNLAPENKIEITDRTPLISASFAPSDEGQIVVSDVVIEFDGDTITDECSIDEFGFSCEIEDDLDLGDHTVSVTILDTNEQSLDQSWVFYVIEDTNGEPSGEDTPEEDGESAISRFFSNIDFSNIDTSQLIPICGGLLFLLVLVFIVNFIRRRRSVDLGEDTFATNEPSPGFEAAPSSFDENPFGSAQEEPFDFSVGSHDVDSEGAPLAVDNSGGAEEIPDWLQGDTETGAQPVGSDGSTFDPTAGSNDSSSEVHNEFELTPNDE